MEKWSESKQQTDRVDQPSSSGMIFFSSPLHLLRFTRHVAYLLISPLPARVALERSPDKMDILLIVVRVSLSLINCNGVGQALFLSLSVSLALLQASAILKAGKKCRSHSSSERHLSKMCL